MKYFKNILAQWLVLAVVITLLSGLVYVVAQQIYRQGANDPQVQLAHDIASKLTQGVSPEKLVPADQILVGSELSPFVIIYDLDHKAVAGNGIYDQGLAQIPAGVLDFANDHGSDRVTWQPDEYTRIALVVEKSGDNKHLVAAGRSLAEVENRESSLTNQIVLGWLFILLASLVLATLLQVFRNIQARAKL